MTIWVHDCPDTAPREIASGDSCPVCGMKEPAAYLTPSAKLSSRNEAIYESARHCNIPGEAIDRFMGTLRMCGFDVLPHDVTQQPPSAEPISPASNLSVSEQMAMGGHTIGIFRDSKLIAADAQVYKEPAGEADATPPVPKWVTSWPEHTGIMGNVEVVPWTDYFQIQLERNRLRRENERLKHINCELVNNHNTLLVDGSKWQSKAEAAERDLAKLQAVVDSAAGELPYEPLDAAFFKTSDGTCYLPREYSDKLHAHAIAKLAAAKQTIELKDAEIARLKINDFHIVVEKVLIAKICEGVRRAVTTGNLDARSMAADNALILEARLDAARSQPSADDAKGKVVQQAKEKT